MKKYFLFLLFSFSILNSQFSIAADKEYFQQEVNYKINVKLDDVKHELSADETLEYTNNSPDELTFVWFHLWANGYKNNNTPLGKQLKQEGNTKFYFAKPDERGYVDALDFKVNGQKVKIENGPSIDMCKLILNEPLKSGGKISITTPFHVKIPLGVFSRMGHIGQQYQITQWYPKPAVYDKYGWHPIPYLNQGEFYSEFGSYDVSITLPKNYVLGATGTLVNGEEETKWLLQKAEETKAILKYNPGDEAFPPSSAETKTLRYQASNVHDFAWFADKRYHVLHDQVILPHSKNKVDTWVMFTNLYGKYWEKAAKYVSDAVYYYSLWNGDYGYPQATAVDGALSAGGGMEYPMITVIGPASSDEELDRVIAHEVGHNWFYGMLGSNERDHAWMDEGINSFNENRYMKTKYNPDSVKTSMSANIGGIRMDIGKIIGVKNLNEETLFDLGYRYNAVKKEDQPVDLTAGEYTTINYGTIVYGKTAVILEYLQAYLGTELYDKCAQKYFETWKFHHPYPDDIKKVYEEVSGKDLSWFFDDLIKTTKQIDYKIVSIKEPTKEDANWEIKIKNKGKISSPFPISAMKNGKIISTTWFEGFKGKNKIQFHSSEVEYDQIKIDAQNIMPDINRQNNTIKTKGLCKKTEPFNLHAFGVVHDPDKTQLFWSPVVGWNNYNKFMLGAAFYNNVLPEKKLEWVIMPMYGFGNKDLAGGASIHYNIHPNKIFQTIRFGVNMERYTEDIYDDEFTKITPEILFEIKRKHLRSTLKQTIHARIIGINGEDKIYDNPLDILNGGNVYEDFTYSLNNLRKINPYNINFNIQQGQEFFGGAFAKASVTANYHITFPKKKKGLDISFFGGKMLYIDNGTDGNFYFFSSGRMGSEDYLYDNVFLGRSETSGFLSQQFAETEGNLKVYTPLGRTSDWLGALNFDCTLPGKIPFRLFADVTTFSHDNMTTIGNSIKQNNHYLLYDFGIHVALVPNTIDVFIPLLMSPDIKNVFYLNNPNLKQPTANNSDPDFLKRTVRMIRFTFNIQRLNPFEFVRNLNL